MYLNLIFSLVKNRIEIAGYTKIYLCERAGTTTGSQKSLIVYVAQRDGKTMYHIYRASIDGGKEVKLTSHESGHVDGPEYSPDGKYIYYNGSQSGTMQLWRMKPDGSGNEQLTFDEYNNWFPHISPDGKWIAFVSGGNGC